jgi:hypothetical protein
MELNRTYQLLIYTEDVRETEALSEASREVGLAVNTVKTK